MGDENHVEPNVRIRRNPEAVYRELADGTGVLLHLGSTAYHGLNQVGSLIWSLLDQEPTFQTLTKQLRSHFPDAPPQLEDDLLEFISQVSERDLVELVPPE